MIFINHTMIDDDNIPFNLFIQTEPFWKSHMHHTNITAFKINMGHFERKGPSSGDYKMQKNYVHGYPIFVLLFNYNI